MISIKNIGKSFKADRTINAVDDVSLDLQRGTFLSIVGRSGSGKSTLLAMAGGILRPTSGSVLIDGTDIWRLGAEELADFRNKSIGYVFQFASLLPMLRVIDNVALPALVRNKLGCKQAYARARALIERVGLADRHDFYPLQLSGGEQRRAAIARALVNAPGLVLADEPTADLDEQTEAEILNLLVDIQRTLDLTMIVVTHNPDIASMADQTLEMRAGRAQHYDVASARAPLRSFDRQAPHAAAGTGGSASVSASLSAPGRKTAVLQRHEGGTGDKQLSSIYEISDHVAAREKIRLGEGVDRYIGRFVMWAAPVFGLIWAINSFVAGYEQRSMQAQTEKRLALEELAMKGLRADVKEIRFGPGKSYILSLYLKNTTGDQPLYVMTPSVRAFIQVGSSWQEVPLKQQQIESGSSVQKIEAERIYRYSLEPPADCNFAQLIPFYMHIRLANDMLVSPSDVPKDNLIDRSDNYYVYLKPHGSDDRAISKRLPFPDQPPVWIPMPPH